MTGSSDRSLPLGLPPDHVLLAIDYLVHSPAFEGVYDPRLVTLTAGGTLIVERRDVDAIMGATATKLGADALERAWSRIASAGVDVDEVLDLPVFASQTMGHTTTVFRSDGGVRSSRLSIPYLGSELIFAGDPPIRAAEMERRAAATALIEDLRAMADQEPWTPPALLMFWRPELPGDWDAKAVAWSAPVDLAAAGHPVEHPVWQRCVRLDGSNAAAVAGFARSLPIDHLVVQGAGRYAISLRPIHEDEVHAVACF